MSRQLQSLEDVEVPTALEVKEKALWNKTHPPPQAYLSIVKVARACFETEVARPPKPLKR
eukprot:4605581-Amphidinium_carterae.1